MSGLDERLESLGAFVLRGDFRRWVRSMAEVDAERRRELVAGYSDPARQPESRRLAAPLAELARILDDFGADDVLLAVGRVGPRLRGQLFAGVNGSHPPGERP
jgi:hypothetical protein